MSLFMNILLCISLIYIVEFKFTLKLGSLINSQVKC